MRPKKVDAIDHIKCLKKRLKISCLIIFLICTVGISSVRAQITTYYFWPAFFNPGDPTNTSWFEPKNWSTYPGLTIPDGINIIINSTCYFNFYSLAIEEGATITIGNTGSLNVDANFSNHGTVSGQGRLRLIGDENQFNFSGGTINCHAFEATDLINSGSINCQEFDGVILATSGTIRNDGNFRGKVTIGKGVFDNRGSFTGQVIGKERTGTLSNSGTMTIEGDPSEVVNMINHSSGTIIIDGVLTTSTYIQNNGTIINNSGLVIKKSSFAVLYALPFYWNNAGTIINDSDILLRYNALFTSTGSIKGNGEITSQSSWTNTGIVSPGNSPGELTFTGTYIEQGTLQIEIGGTIAITEYDVFSPRLYSNQSGTLQVELINGFVPELGNSFRIVNTVGMGGTFETLNLPELPPGLEWQVEYNSQNITLRVAAILVPVTWLDFTVSADDRKDGSAFLNWSTAEEINNLGFEVERSEDGRTWEQIGFEAASTKTDDQYDYKYIDLNPKKGLNYYRLKQVDYDGAYEYSVVRSINLKGDESTFAVFPNPSYDGLLNLEIEKEETENLDLIIMDLSGRIVYSQKVSADRGINQISLNTPDLSAGTYIIILSSKKQQSQQKWVKL